MKRLLHALLLLCLTATGAFAQTGTPQTKTLLNTETTTNFPDNTTGLITPAITRQSLVDYIASWQQAPRVNPQTGTTYTVVVDDYGKLVTFNNGGAVAVTLPQATTSFATFNWMACNIGAGLVTITPTTSTIDGAATSTIANTACRWIVSDGTNYKTLPFNGCGSGLTLTNTTCGLSAARQTLPTTSQATIGAHSGGMSANGSGTYTTPANVLWIEIWLVGGGGGGGSGGTNGANGGAGGNTCWNTTGAACTSPVYQAGGAAGGQGTLNGTAGGAGGTIAGSGTCSWTVVGGAGEGAPVLAPTGATGVPGGGGGVSIRGGAGNGTVNTIGGSAATDSGSGGQGGGNSPNGGLSGGGGAGAACYVLIPNPVATYTYAVGAAGAAGTGGGTNGGAGGSGWIYVLEHYGS